MDLAKVVFFGRTGEDALAFFDLDPGLWRGRTVLDCPGGPGSFTALAHRLGIDALAVDPLYDHPLEEQERQARADIDLHGAKAPGGGHLRAGFALASYQRAKLRALAEYLADARRFPDRYRAAALPRLPFADASFDLVLSGHLLFSYAPEAEGGLLAGSPFDLAWHRQALAELCRVSRAEVRVYPAHTITRPARPHPYLEPLLGGLEPLWRAELYAPRYDQGLEGETPGLRLQRIQAP